MKTIKQLNEDTNNGIEIIKRTIDSTEKHYPKTYYLDELVGGGFAISQDDCILSTHKTEEDAKAEFVRI